jgi:hypothetical protein
VAAPGGCLIYTGPFNNRGYGTISTTVNGASASASAHRVVYEALVGPIPTGLQLDHLCRTRACVNPAHLEPVTRRENILRGESPSAVHARKTHCIRGHEFTPENTHTRSDGSRSCRKCGARRKRLARNPKGDA